MILLEPFDERTLDGMPRLMGNADFKAFVEYLERQDIKILRLGRKEDNDTAVRQCQGAGKVLELLLEQMRGARDVLEAKHSPKKKGVY